MLDQMIRSG